MSQATKSKEIERLLWLRVCSGNGSDFYVIRFELFAGCDAAVQPTDAVDQGRGHHGTCSLNIEADPALLFLSLHLLLLFSFSLSLSLSLSHTHTHTYTHIYIYMLSVSSRAHLTFSVSAVSPAQNELFDMIHPVDRSRITLKDVLDSGCGHTFVSILTDVNGFLSYENRESEKGPQEGE